VDVHARRSLGRRPHTCYRPGAVFLYRWTHVVVGRRPRTTAGSARTRRRRRPRPATRMGRWWRWRHRNVKTLIVKL